VEAVCLGCSALPDRREGWAVGRGFVVALCRGCAVLPDRREGWAVVCGFVKAVCLVVFRSA
jgi:hypothetical protein